RLNFLNGNAGAPLVANPPNKPKPLVCGSTDGFDSLWRLNVAACVLHAVFAILTLITGLAGNSPFQVVVTRSLPIVPNPIPFPFNSTDCGGETYDDVFKWFKCIRETYGEEYKTGLVEQNGYSVISEESGSPDTVMPPFQTSYLLTNEWQMWTLIFAFCMLTSLSHALIAWPLREAYEYWLTQDRQPLRYLEYSLTASIMFVIVLALTRVTDLYLLLANALLMCCVNVFGGVIEWVTLGLPVEFTPRPWAIRAWAWAVSGLVFVFQFWQLWDIYDQTVGPWLDEDNETSELMAQLFGFVTILNVVILVCFLTFPIVNIVQFMYYTNARCRQCMQRASTSDLYFALRFEAAYVFCSLIAKAALVIIVFVAAVQRG
ncbi:hypothetical protein N9A45_01965, partial [bacterium]|nr:hypothetical protein [bacterium]